MSENLLKRLSEIEGWTWDHSWGSEGAVDEGWYDHDHYMTPLTNDAQALALVKKYHIYLEPEYYDKCEHEREFSGKWAASTPHGRLIFHEDLNTAICMAVVEAHK